MKTYTIGRSPEANIVLTANLSSRNHAKLTVSDTGKIILQDFSSNGTTVNGKKINNQSVEINHFDEVLFAGVEKLDWSKIEVSENATVSEEKPKPEESAPKSRWGNYALKTGLAVGVVALLVFGVKLTLSKTETPQIQTANEIYNRYKKSVALVEVTFYVKVHTKANDLYFGFDKDGNVSFERTIDGLKPFSSQGTAFFVDSNGTLVTNKHVALPWQFNRELSTYFFKRVKPRIQQALREKGWGNDEPEFEAEFQKYYVYLNGTTYAPSNRIPCEIVKTSDKDDIDLATLQISSHKLPATATIVPSESIEINEQKIEVGTPAIVISFPYGDELAKNENDELNCTVTSGNFTQPPAKYYVQYSAQVASGSSGSPVFNEYGQLVAVTYEGTPSGQSFNRGILVKYVRKLIQQSPTQ